MSALSDRIAKVLTTPRLLGAGLAAPEIRTLAQRIEAELFPIETSAEDWWPVSSRSGMGVAVPESDFPVDPQIGDRLRIDGTEYQVHGVEQPGPRSGHWGLLVQQIGSYSTGGTGK